MRQQLSFHPLTLAFCPSRVAHIHHGGLFMYAPSAVRLATIVLAKAQDLW
jgi:hypothetical protein